MTSKEKAKELYDKHNCVSWNLHDIDSKDCAIITVDQILECLSGISKPEYAVFDCFEPRKFTVNEPEYETHITGDEIKEYWQQVKQHLNEM